MEGRLAGSREARDLADTDVSATIRTYEKPHADPKRNRLVATGTPFSLRFVYFVWLLTLFEPDWWLASFGMGPLNRLGFILFPIAAGIVLLKSDRRSVYWPMLAWVALHVTWVANPFVTNRGYALNAAKIELLFYVFLVALPAVMIKDARRALPMVSLSLIQFGWWAVHGFPSGRILWHPTLANEDGYGPLMVIGLAFATFVALGARRRNFRLMGIIVAGSCAIGLVVSFARGAVLAGGVVVVALLLRSPRKLLMLGLVVLMGVVVVVASAVLFPGGAFWDEMWTSFDGFDDPTGGDRRDLWQAGWRVFRGSPLVGVGPANFGAYAAEHFGWGDASAFYEDPARLYGRNLHNIYVQLFAEQGLVGVTVFLIILIDFVRRNRQLRTRRAIEYWESATGGPIDLRFIALGLETGLLGYLASAVFYDQLYMTSLYWLLALNLLLHSVVVRGGGTDQLIVSPMAGKTRATGQSAATPLLMP